MHFDFGPPIPIHLNFERASFFLYNRNGCSYLRTIEPQTSCARSFLTLKLPLSLDCIHSSPPSPFLFRTLFSTWLAIGRILKSLTNKYVLSVVCANILGRVNNHYLILQYLFRYFWFRGVWVYMVPC